MQFKLIKSFAFLYLFLTLTGATTEGSASGTTTKLSECGHELKFFRQYKALENIPLYQSPKKPYIAKDDMFFLIPMVNISDDCLLLAYMKDAQTKKIYQVVIKGQNLVGTKIKEINDFYD